MINDLKQYLKIDKLALDEELTQQASLLYQISEEYAVAVGERDGLKESLAIEAAKADQRAREQLGDKATEPKVKALVTLDEQRIAANGKYLDAKYQADALEALKDSFQQRGYMLRDLAQLYISNYYTTDSVRSTPQTNEALYRSKRMQKYAKD